MSVIRTFVALELAPDVRSEIARLIDKLRPSADLKWVDVENLHITIKFLGDVEDVQLPEVCQAVAEAAAASAPFSLESVGVGAFPDIRRPKTIWIGAGEGAEEATKFYRAANQALRKLGFPRETRKFHPHVTIGRTRRGGAPAGLAESLQAEVDFSAGVSSVDEAILFGSELTPTGPVYTVLSRSKFTG